MTAHITRTDDLAACHAIRRVVFIDEQAVPEELEMDDLDGEAIHLLATVDGRPAGETPLDLALRPGTLGVNVVLLESTLQPQNLLVRIVGRRATPIVCAVVAGEYTCRTP